MASKNIFKNEVVIQFSRTSLLILIASYILFRVFDTMGLFVEEINCGAETVVVKNKKTYFEANGCLFSNAIGYTNDMALEGAASVKLTTRDQYGLSIALGIPRAKFVYETSVWFYEDFKSADSSGAPALVASIGKQFWESATEVIDWRDGWSKLQMKVTVPEGSYSEPMVIYCWNSTKNNVYFDNLIIKRKNYWKFFKQ